jgi:hypothetical protein
VKGELVWVTDWAVARVCNYRSWADRQLVSLGDDRPVECT